MDPLFRHEALAAKSGNWLGTVRLSQPIGYSVVASAGIAVAAVIICFALFGTYTKKATVVGMLTPTNGALRITGSSSGTVVEVRAKEGAAVSVGDVLFVISGERTSDIGETQQLIALELKRRANMSDHDVLLSRTRAATRIASLESRISAIDVEIATFVKDAELHADRERIAADAFDRYQKLVTTGFMSPSQADAKREELLALQSQRQASLRSKASLERERASLVAQTQESRMQAESEASEAAKSRALLAQEITENQARTRLIVRAPSNGTISGIAVQVGQSSAVGSLLATLLPHDKSGKTQALEGHFFATTRQAGFVEKGQRVMIRYAAYPYQKFGLGLGQVTEVSKSPYAVQELPTHVAATLQSVAQAGDPVYRVTVLIKQQSVAAYGSEHLLKPGMLAEADIVQDTRRIWEWILEPVFSVSGRLAQSVPPFQELSSLPTSLNRSTVRNDA